MKCKQNKAEELRNTKCIIFGHNFFLLINIKVEINTMQCNNSFKFICRERDILGSFTRIGKGMMKYQHSTIIHQNYMSSNV